MMSSCRTHIPALLVLLTMLTTLPVDAQSLSERVRDHYGSGMALQARFVQHIASDFLDTEERFTGELWLRGDNYRIETGGQTIVSDGRTSWIHNRAEHQVLINTVDPDDDGFSLTSFLSEFDSAYAIESKPDSVLEGTAVHAMVLTPIDPFASFQRVSMWVRSSNLDIVRLHVVDLNDVFMEFRLNDSRFLPAEQLPDSTFAFRMPDGVDVIDLR